MLNRIFKFFSKHVKIIDPLILLDGDQGYEVIEAYKGMYTSKAEFISVVNFPRTVKRDPLIISGKISLMSLARMGGKGKETTDKFISMKLQQSISEGRKDFIVISSDCDFVDIFKMLSVVNPDKELNFTLVVPKAKGRITKIKSTSTIKIVRL